MTVLLISSIFTSVGRFGDDFSFGELGWLLIDKAGRRHFRRTSAPFGRHHLR